MTNKPSTSAAVLPPPEISLEHEDWIEEAADVRVEFEHIGVDDEQSEPR